MFFCSRYNRTVHEYTASNVTQDPQVATLLLIQLLEGIAHLTRYGVAHRDLKTDNLLLDESTSDLCPHLVIADFGCCLADQQWGLTLPFITEEIDRGGNSALMAPEVFFLFLFLLLCRCLFVFLLGSAPFLRMFLSPFFFFHFYCQYSSLFFFCSWSLL